MTAKGVISQSNYIPFSSAGPEHFSEYQNSGTGPNEQTCAMNILEDECNATAIPTFSSPSDVPTASVTIAHHDDWKLLMKKDEDIIPELKELTRRLEHFYFIKENDSTEAVFLTTKDSATESEQMDSNVKQKQKEHLSETDGHKEYDHLPALPFENYGLQESFCSDYTDSYPPPLSSRCKDLMSTAAASHSEPGPMSPPPLNHDYENYNPFSRIRTPSLRHSASGSSMNSVFSEHNGKRRIERDFSDNEDDNGVKGEKEDVDMDVDSRKVSKDCELRLHRGQGMP
ncbi:hypothetical protein BDQ17DRAFT_646237 [Cyathus striatus]|nr:hypothetical protein BDQ17DRAFT_646237 [Cyathus striatus]